MNWKYATDSMLVQYFEHENVWAKKWERVRTGDALVKVPDTGEQLQLAIYEAEFKGKRKQFAAGEVSNGINLFYIPAL